MNLLSSKSAPSPAAGAEDATSTSIAAERLRLALASPPLGEAAGAAEAATVAWVEGDRTRYPSREPLAPLGLPCCDPSRGGSSLREEGLGFLAGKNCGGGRSRGEVRARRQGGKCGQEFGLGFYLVDLGTRGARRHCGGEGEGRYSVSFEMGGGDGAGGGPPF